MNCEKPCVSYYKGGYVVFFRLATCALLVALSATSVTSAEQQISPKPQASEVAFVTGIQKDLMKRFPTAKDAEAAGYFRYTNEDKSGAISYANLQWQSSDPAHPSQLWYDVKGNLLGADFSVLKSTSPKPPKLWGVDPRRWEDFEQHVHWIITGKDGMETYGGSGKKFVAAGGDLNDPKTETLVKMGVVKDPTTVKRIFAFPALWDLIVWVKPNPNGAFAELNPLVKPSKPASHSM